MPQHQKSEHDNVGSKAGVRISNIFGVVRAMHVIGTADELIELRERNEARLAIAKKQPVGRQVYRPV